MPACRRCDYRADDLTDHALDSGHLLCIVDQRRSLAEFEHQTCGFCAARVREHLTDIEAAYALLRPAGVTALTLLGDGTMQRLWHPYEHVVVTRHPLARDNDRVRDAPVRDEWPNDPLPVVPLLASWADMVREHYGDPIPTSARAGNTLVNRYAQLELDTGYLIAALAERGLDLAQTFPAFDEFAATLRQARAVTLAAVGLADDPVAADAPCVECDGRLIRAYRPLATGRSLQDRLAAAGRRIEAELVAPVRRQRFAEQTYGVTDLTPWPSVHARREVVRAAVLGDEAEGLTDLWACEDCERVYKPAEYLLALRNHHAVSSPEWRTPTVAAWLVDRPFRTVQAWLGVEVTVACRLEDRRLVAWMPDVVAASKAAARQSRSVAA